MSNKPTVISNLFPKYTWWRHQMETWSALLPFYAGNSPVTAEFPAQRRGTRSFDVFFICSWINGRANNREAGDLRRHRAHYDVTVMGYFNIIWKYFFIDRWLHHFGEDRHCFPGRHESQSHLPSSGYCRRLGFHHSWQWVYRFGRVSGVVLIFQCSNIKPPV